MADTKCTITSATIEIETPKKDNVGETTAIAKCKASAKLPADEIGKAADLGLGSWNAGGQIQVYTLNQSRTITTYKDLVYKWTASSPGDVDKEGAEVNLQFANLARGKKQSIYATVKVSCTKVVQTQTRYLYDAYDGVVDDDHFIGTFGSDEWGDSGDADETEGACENSQQTTSVDVWTRPGTFEQYGGGWKMKAKKTIQAGDGLSSGWTNLWADHMDKIGHWYQQSDTDVAQGARQVAGDIITASWYNTCVNLINTYTDGEGSATDVTGGPDGNVITADIINVLYDENKRTGEVST